MTTILESNDPLMSYAAMHHRLEEFSRIVFNAGAYRRTTFRNWTVPGNVSNGFDMRDSGLNTRISRFDLSRFMPSPFLDVGWHRKMASQTTANNERFTFDKPVALENAVATHS